MGIEVNTKKFYNMQEIVYEARQEKYPSEKEILGASFVRDETDRLHYT